MRISRKDYEIYYKDILPLLKANGIENKNIKSLIEFKRNARRYNAHVQKVKYLEDEEYGHYMVKKVFVNTSPKLVELYYDTYVVPHYIQHDRKCVYWHRVFNTGDKTFLYWRVEYE